MTDAGSVPGEALADVAYLARSENRVVVLEALTEEPRSVRELRECSETSRTTLNRLLTEFEERDWARRDADGAYRATPQGHHVAVQFERLVASMATVRELGDASSVFPPTELAVGDTEAVFDLGAFGDVTVHRTTRMEPDKLYDAWTDRIRESSTLRILAGAGPTETGNAVIHEEVISGRTETTAVCSAPLVELFLDPDRGHATPEDIRDRHEAGGRLYRYAGSVPSNVSIFDDAVFVSNRQADTAIETENETVRAWAIEFFERYLAAAEMVGEDELLPE